MFTVTTSSQNLIISTPILQLILHVLDRTKLLVNNGKA